MAKCVAIVTESTSNLPAQLVEQYNISVLPMKLNLGDESLRDGVDISAEEIYRRQVEENDIPRTNTFSPGDGEVSAISRPRTWRRACTRLVDLMAQCVADSPVHIGVNHVRHNGSAAKIADRFQTQFDVEELYINHLTPVMGATSGPVLALSYYCDD